MEKRTTPSTNSLLRIDAANAAEAIKTYLHKTYDQQSAAGVSIGLSGGIDSAVLTTLAIQAFGKQQVHVTYLFDRDSERKIGHRARMVADWLGLELNTKSIEPEMRRGSVYAPPSVRITSLSGPINRCLHRAYCLRFGEIPFISLLRLGSVDYTNQEPRGLVFRRALRHIETGINTRHIYRRVILEQEARDQNWLLLGAANRTEWLVGWFVKDGIDDLPTQPLKGLYKTQVRQLVAFLGIPDPVKTQAPTPDMIRGITDEFALGMRYGKIDIIFDLLEGGLAEQQLSEAGITKKNIHQVQEMKRLSSWKRTSASTPPPVDGGPKGGFRGAGDR